MGHIRQDEFMPDAPDRAGTARINHKSCPAGEDIRRRLYVTRKEDGNVIAYCHNCSNSGFHGSASRFRRNPVDVPLVESEEKELIMPEYMRNDKNYWPKEMIAWLIECGIPLQIAQEYGICYDSKRHRVVIPKLNKDGTLVQYQSRRLVDDGSPKYLTNKLKHEYIHDPIGPGGSTCIIVEDMISSIRLAMLGYDAVPLFTDTMDSESMLTLVGKYDKIYVWLDNDSVVVDRHADVIVTGLRLLDQDAQRITGFRDPKHYYDVVIDQIVKLMED